MEKGHINKEFFQDLLRKFEENDSIIVEKFRISPAVDKGNNFASVVSRVVVKGFKVENNNEKSEYKVSLIMKQLVKNKFLLETYHFDVIFLNESEAYNTIIPTLGKCTPTGSLNTAKCLIANKDIVVLKDLAQDGYKNIDKCKDFEVAEAKLTLTELAKLHAASFVLRQRDSDLLDHLGTLTRDILFNNNDDVHLKMQTMTYDLAIYVFKELEQSELNLKAIKVLEDMRDNAAERQTKLITEHRKHKVINHGDTWGNNILIKDDTVILIDLQIMRYVSVAADLSYFLYINLHPCTRRQNHDSLLQHYLDTLHAQICACDVNMRSELTMDWLRSEMNDFALFGVISALAILPVFHYDNAELDLDELTENEFGDINWHVARMTDGYKRRLVELVVDYVENNATE